MSDNGFCSDCPAYWEYDGDESCLYKLEPTRAYHSACEDMPMLVEYFKAIDRALIKGDGKSGIGIIGGSESTREEGAL